MGEPSPAPIPGSKTSTLRRLYRGSFAPSAPFVAGDVVASRYRIVALLGQGGMGAVYRASRVADEMPIAVKVIRSDHAGDANMAERFEREASYASRVASAHVSRVLDHGRDLDGTLFLAMELLVGKSLFRHLDEALVLPWRRALQVARSVAEGLAAVHGAGLVHRDLKPDNVFLCEDGAIKILDFGIAKEFGTGWDQQQVGKALTQAGTVLGTPLYMSPEAVTGSALGPPSDLYALGAILFEMLTGRLLFEEEQPVLLMGHHLRTKPDRVTQVRSDLGIPAELDALVDRLLAKDPKKRPASASEVVDAIDEILAAANDDSGRFAAIGPRDHKRAIAALPTDVLEQELTIPKRPVGLAGEATRIDPIARPAAPSLPESAAPDTTPSRALAQRVSVMLGAVVALGLAVGLGMWLGGRGQGATTAPPTAHETAPTTTVSSPPTPSSAATPIPTATPVPPTVAAAPPSSAAPPPSGAQSATPPPSVAPPPPASTVGLLPSTAIPRHDTPPPPPTSELAADAPATATFHFVLTPPGAQISESGAPVSDPLVVARDGAVHVFLVEAPGREAERVSLRADQDRTARVTLAPRRRTDIAREF